MSYDEIYVNGQTWWRMSEDEEYVLEERDDEDDDGDPIDESLIGCKFCNGWGRIQDENNPECGSEPCPVCDGSGHIQIYFYKT